MASSRDRESLTDQLVKVEEQIGADPHPLIIISPNGTLKLEPRILDSRMYRLLPSPFTISRLAETANNLLPPEDADIAVTESAKPSRANRSAA